MFNSIQKARQYNGIKKKGKRTTDYLKHTKQRMIEQLKLH